MSKLNNKGFAVSTILYGILSLTILILLLIFAIMKSSKDMNQDLSKSIEENLNKCVTYEVALDNCYFENASCVKELYEYSTCINKNSTLTNKILEDNIAYNEKTSSKYVTSSSGINLNASNSDSNGKGLYYTNISPDSELVTYYFRGDVENNYVKFANYYWRILRINEDNSVRMIYQGATPNATSSDASVANIMFQRVDEQTPSHVGYMYGDNLYSYVEAHSNINESQIKQELDKWYQNNLIEYVDYLSVDAGFCNDRTILEGNGFSTTVVTKYMKNKQFFLCENKNDLFTTSTSVNGNKKLQYPVGLITLSDVIHAGGSDHNNSNYFLYTGSSFWTISPQQYTIVSGVPRTTNFIVNRNGSISSDSVVNYNSIRPVINLKPTVLVVSGNGTKDAPYIIT